MRYFFSTFFTMAIFLMAFRTLQEIRISGNVKDENGLALAGVTVTEKQNHQGIHEGTLSGQDGRFSLTVSTKNPVLIFQLAGYEQQEIKVKDCEKPIQVILKAAVRTLHEVVVTGYGTMKRKDVTGSVATEDERAVSPSSSLSYSSPRTSFSKTEKLEEEFPNSEKKYFQPGLDTTQFNTEEYDANRREQVSDCDRKPIIYFFDRCGRRFLQ